LFLKKLHNDSLDGTVTTPPDERPSNQGLYFNLELCTVEIHSVVHYHITVNYNITTSITYVVIDCNMILNNQGSSRI
jgi:hypothetical protein